MILQRRPPRICVWAAMEYAESVLADAEGKLKELKSVVYSESIKTDDYFAQTLDVLAENIQELRMGK